MHAQVNTSHNHAYMMNVATRVILTCGGSVRCSISSPDLGCPFFSPIVIELADVSGPSSLGLHLGKPLEGLGSDLDQAVDSLNTYITVSHGGSDKDLHCTNRRLLYLRGGTSTAGRDAMLVCTAKPDVPV